MTFWPASSFTADDALVSPLQRRAEDVFTDNQGEDCTQDCLRVDRENVHSIVNPDFHRNVKVVEAKQKALWLNRILKELTFTGISMLDSVYVISNKATVWMYPQLNSPIAAL